MIRWLWFDARVKILVWIMRSWERRYYTATGQNPLRDVAGYLAWLEPQSPTLHHAINWGLANGLLQRAGQ